MKKHFITLLLVAIATTACTTNSNNPSDSETEAILHTSTITSEVPTTEESTTSKSTSHILTPEDMIDLQDNDPLEEGAKMFMGGDTQTEELPYHIGLNSKKLDNGNIELYLRTMNFSNDIRKKIVIGEYRSEPILFEPDIIPSLQDIFVYCKVDDTYIVVTHDEFFISVYEVSSSNLQNPKKLFDVSKKDT